MAEEKSAPKKEKTPKVAAAGAEVKAPAVDKPAKASKAPKTEGAEGAAPAPAADQKPVELIGGVAKQPTAEDLLKEELGAIKVRKAKGSKNVSSGVANVLASFNNTVVSISDPHGGVIAWSSAGRAGFKGSRKSTAFAATVVGQEAARVAVSKGMTEVEVRVQGPGAGRESAIRALQATGLLVTVIKDLTPMPHNGCRPRKRRRV